MKKNKKTLNLNKLVISKLTNSSTIMGGSELNCSPTESRIPGVPVCAPDPSETCMNCPSIRGHAC
ncbi:hypothetical protein GCM10011344_38850 [Dokdonia pacifica]|uniref:Class I lanthipeptide n=1 Tax=Dokdonia pacifica TaxID=1627892 RepID=A0A239A081_9FLAO|nr:hypothetical protein GCM10011344_38850 [Dokdonia pacifica]SNR89047.1 hypothetical protein SAMN06265376_10463 [Dokdonia pacifica]